MLILPRSNSCACARETYSLSAFILFIFPVVNQVLAHGYVNRMLCLFIYYHNIQPGFYIVLDFVSILNSLMQYIYNGSTLFSTNCADAITEAPRPNVDFSLGEFLPDGSLHHYRKGYVSEDLINGYLIILYAYYARISWGLPDSVLSLRCQCMQARK